MSAQVPRSFELAFADLYRLAYRVAFRILGDRAEAEDIAQEALARATLRWDKLHDRPEGWVTKVASNLALDRYRRRRRRSQLRTGPLGIVDDRTVERSDLVTALRRLPRRRARSGGSALPGRLRRVGRGAGARVLRRFGQDPRIEGSVGAPPSAR